MKVEGFETMEEAFAAMRAAEQAANDRTTTQQKQITYGDCWMRPMGREYDHVVIFGRVQSLEELFASEVLGVTSFGDEDERATALVAATDLIAEMKLTYGLSVHEVMTTGEKFELMAERLERFGDEARWSLESMVERYLRGYRFGMAWSLMEPRGEYGDTHVSEMIPLSTKEFGDAMKAGWQFLDLVDPESERRADWAVDLIGATMDELHARVV